MLKSLPSALVWMYTPSLQSLKAYWEEHGEDDAEERRRKDAALLYPAADRKGLGGGAVEAYYAVHVAVE